MPIELSNGLWWPVGDRHCRSAALRQYHDVDLALTHVKDFNSCIQAGGNCGVWASYLAAHFAEVWTIEADFTNYRCLLRNTANIDCVHPIWAALSDKSGRSVALNRDIQNVGAHHINGSSSAEEVTTLAIDDLELEHCGLLQLDIEGHEPVALLGARKTIERCKPVIMVEDNGTCSRYGYKAGWEKEFFGYRVADTVNRDVILVPC